MTTPRGRGARGSARRLAALWRACAAAVAGAWSARRFAVPALAGLLALACAVPAVAQDPVWSATVTVENDGEKWGFYRQGGLEIEIFELEGPVELDDLGSLDDDEFEYGTPAVTYTVKSLLWSTGGGREVIFVPDPALPAEATRALVLSIGDDDFALGAASLTETRKYTWDQGYAGSSLPTVENATAAVSLSVAPNAPPAFDDDALVRTVLENSRADVPVGEPIPAATDANAGDTLTYSLEGTDAGSFAFDPATRQISTKAGVTYDIDTKPSYSVTVRVADDDGESDTVAVTVNVVANLAPAFDDDALVRTVAENSGPNVAVGDPIPAATDANAGDILTYSLEGTDAASFAFDPATRQISTKAGVTYDYDTSPSYAVTVKVEDVAGASDSVAVTVNVVANLPPAFAVRELRRTVAEDSGPNQRVGQPIPAATDPDPGDTLTYSLAGTDAGSFEFDPATRQISTKAGVVYEFDTQRSYSVTVRVEDAEGDSDTVAVTIHVNVEPFFADARLERTVLANSPPGVPVGEPIPAAADANPGDTLTYSLAGTDAGSFNFDPTARQILTKAGVTYDRSRKPRYSVTVRVEDAIGLWATVAVTIDVIDCPERSGVAAGVSFDSATYAAAEGGFAATVRVNLTTALGEPVTVPLLARPAGGASVSDYTVPAAVEIGCGTTEATFELEPLPDTEAETNERVELAFGPLPPGVVAGARVETTVWLTDAEQAVWTASLTLGGHAAHFGYGTGVEGGSLSVPAFNLAGVPYVVEYMGFFRSGESGRRVTAELTVSGGGGLPEGGLEGLILEFAGEAYLLGGTSASGIVHVRLNREADIDLNSRFEDGRLRKGDTVRVCLRPPDRSCAGDVVPTAPLWLAFLDPGNLDGNRHGAAGVINRLLPREFRLNGVNYTVDELSFATAAGERRRLRLSAPVAESERGSFAGLVLEVDGYGMPVAGVGADGEFDLGDDALPDELFFDLSTGTELLVCLRHAGASCDLAATAAPSPLVLPDVWRATLGAATVTQDDMGALSRGYRRDLSAGSVNPETFRWQGRDYRVDELEFRGGLVTFSFSAVVDGRRRAHQSLASDGRLRLEVADEVLTLDGQYASGTGYRWLSAWTTANAPSLDNDSWNETIVHGVNYPVRLVQTVPTLSALSLGDVELSPAFSPAITGYRAGLPPGESRVTVTAEATESAASVTIEPPDADRDTSGHQVDVEAGAATPIVVGVEIDDRALAYRIDVAREAPASPGQGATVWATAMIAGSFLDGIGYRAVHDGRGLGGQLLDDDFTLYGERYEVAALHMFRTGLTLKASRNGAAAHAELNHLTLVVGGVALPLAEATSSATGLLWPTAWLDANAPEIARLLGKSGAVVRVKLRRISQLARLSGLSLAGIALTPVFEPGLRVYSTLRTVADDLESVTLRVENAEAATVTVVAPDADPAAAGHQVALGDGTTEIRVNLVSQDGTATGAYRVFVAKSAAVEVWRATLTSGVDVANEEYGHIPTTGLRQTLVPDTFELGGRTEKVTALYWDGGDSEFKIWLEPPNDPGAIDDATLREMVFRVGEAVLPGRNASRSAEDDVAALKWSATWLTANAASLGPADVETTLADGEQLAVSLRVPPQPDPRLAALSLDGARLSRRFEPGVRSYTAFAQEPVATVRAEPLDPSSSVSISPPDAMPDVAGHQVRLPAGEAVEIGVTVRQPRGSRTYTVSTAQAAGAWSSTMTVGFDIDDEDRDWVGYDRGHLGNDRYGALSGDREFTLDFGGEDFQAWNVIRLAVQSALRDDLSDPEDRKSSVELWLQSAVRGCRTTRLSLRIAGVTLPLASALTFQVFDDDITWVCKHEWHGPWLEANAPELLAERADRLLPVDAEVPVALVEESIARPFLRDLSLSGASPFPPFRQELFDYEAAVAAAQVTVSAPPALSDAQVTIEPPDADTDTGGHQVALTAGTETTITVTVRHLEEVRTYRVRVGAQQGIWNAVMVIGEHRGSEGNVIRGYQRGSYGSVVPDRFALNGVSYTVDELNFGTSNEALFGVVCPPGKNTGPFNTCELGANPGFAGRVLEVGGHAIPVRGTSTQGVSIHLGSVPPELGNTGDPLPYLTTLPLGQAATVCLRSAGGSCPTGRIGDPPPSTKVSAAFGRAAYEAAEGGLAAPVEVRLGAPATADLVVPLIFTNLDGASDRDHGGGPLAVVRIPAGADSGTFALAAVDDAENDNGEAVEVTMGALPPEYAFGTPSSARVALVDNDVPAVSVRFGARGYLAVEGGAAATVTVTLDGAPDRALRIPLTVRRGAGVTDGDVGPFPVLVEFGPEETEKTFAVTALDDSDAEPDETLTLGFGTLPGGVTARSPASAVVLLGDDDIAPVQVAFGSPWYSAFEGRDGAGNRIVPTVAVRLSRAPRKAVDVRLSTAEQGGATNSDWDNDLGTLRFGALEREKTFAVWALDDSHDDDGESVRLSFDSVPVGYAAGAPTTVWLVDDDGDGVTATFEAGSYVSGTYLAAEGGDPPVATVAVKVEPPPGRPLTLPLTFTHGAGATSLDYQVLPSGSAAVVAGAGVDSVTFDPDCANAKDRPQCEALYFDEWRDSVAVRAVDDVEAEGVETVTLGFGALPAGVATGEPASAVVRLEDDDEATPSVGFGAASYVAYENPADGGAATVEVVLSRRLREDEGVVTVPIRFERRIATDADHGPVAAGVIFRPGAAGARATFEVAAIDDNNDDDGESLELSIGPTLPDGVRAGAMDTTRVWLVDDEFETLHVSFEEATYRAVEGGSAVTVAVVLDLPLDDPDAEGFISIPLTRTHLGGAEEADYGVPAAVRIGTSSQDPRGTVEFTAFSDDVGEDGEGVELGFGFLPPDLVPESPTTATVLLLESADDLRWTDVNAVRVGDRLEVAREAILDPDGVPDSGIGYQWWRSPGGRETKWTEIDGATGSVYRPTVDDDAGMLLRPVVKFTDEGTPGTMETRTGSPVAVRPQGAIWGAVLRPGDFEYSDLSGRGYARVGDVRAGALTDTEFVYAGRDYTMESLGFGDDSAFFGFADSVDGAFDTDLQMYLGPHTVVLQTPDGSRTLVLNAPDELDTNHADADPEFVAGSVWPVFLVAVQTVSVRALHREFYAGLDNPVEFRLTRTVGAAVRDAMPVDEALEVALLVEQAESFIRADAEESFTFDAGARAGIKSFISEYFRVFGQGENLAPLTVSVAAGRRGYVPANVGAAMTVRTEAPAVVFGIAKVGTTLARSDSDYLLVEGAPPGDNVVTVVAQNPRTGTPSIRGTMKIDLVTGGGTATSPHDYVSLGGGLDIRGTPDSRVNFRYNFVDVPLEVVDDLLIEGDETFSVILDRSAGLPVQRAAFSNRTRNGFPCLVGGDDDCLQGMATVQVTLKDNDDAVVQFDRTAISVREGETAELTLDTYPQDPLERGYDLAVELTATAPAGALETDVETSYTLPGKPADEMDEDLSGEPVTVTVATADNDTTDGAREVVLTIDSVGRGIPVGERGTVTVTIVDDDVPGLIVEPRTTAAAPLVVPQEETREVMVRLQSEPTADVTVSVSNAVTDAGDVRVDRTSMTFPMTDWKGVETLTVSAPEDRDADDEAVTLRLAASGGGYGAVTADVYVQVDDPDTNGVVATPPAFTLAEGDSASYTLEITNAPVGDDVVVTLDADDGLVTTDGGGTPLPRVTFMPGDWSARTVRLQATDNDVAVVNDLTLAIRHTAAGGGYDGVVGDTVAVTVQDDDTAGISVDRTGVDVPEGESEDIEVTLTSEPSAPVMVTVDGHESTDVEPTPNPLVFNAMNWESGETLTVRVAEDDDAVDEPAVTLTLTASDAAPEYADKTAEVDVTSTDNDRASVGLVLTPDRLEVEEEDGDGASYTVQLGSEPTRAVSVTITGHENTDLELSATELSFPVADWDTAQTVTVTAGEDDDYDNDEATLVHTAVSDDDAYDLVKHLDVKILDNDRAPATARFVSRPRHGDAYGTAQTEYIVVAVAFEDVAIVEGEPRLKLAFDNGEERMAAYHSGAGTPTLFFEYKVRSDRTADGVGYLDYDEDGVGIPEESLDLPDGATVTVDRQPAGHPAPVRSRAGHRVNVPVWVVTADPLGIAEGESATVTARSVNGAQTLEETAVNLIVRGDRADYALSPEPRRDIDARITEVTWTIEALADDDAPERPEVLGLQFVQDGPYGGGLAGELAIREAGEQPGLPGRPLNLVAMGRLHDAVLTWSAPASGPKPDGYQWRERYGNTRWRDVPAGALRAEPDTLVYGFSYQLEVRAVRDGAGGPAAGPVFVTVGHDGILSAPTNLQAFAGNDSVELTWKPPAERIATGYEVEVDLNRRWMRTDEMDSHFVENLTPGAAVPLAVRGIDEFGVPGPAASITATPGGANAAASGPRVGPPRLISATARGTRVELRYDRPLDANARPVDADFLVVADGEPRALSSVRVAGALVVLELAAPVAAEARVAASYPAPGAHPVRDSAGRLAGPSYRAPVRVLAPLDVAETAPGVEESSPESLFEVPTVTPLPAPGAALFAALELPDLAAFRPDAPWRRRGDLQGMADPRLAAAFAEALGASPDGAVADLAVLRADRRGIVALGGIGRAADLAELDLTGNALADLAPLAVLAELRRLHLGGNAASDLAPLAGLSKLKRLDLAGNRVADLGPLANLVNLETLLLADNAVSDLTPLVHLGSLVRLDLSGNPVTDLAALADLRALRRLDLAGARVADVSPLGDVGSLVWLDLSGNPLADPSPIGRLARLRWLFADDPAALAWLVDPARRTRLEVHPGTP